MTTTAATNAYSSQLALSTFDFITTTQMPLSSRMMKGSTTCPCRPIFLNNNYHNSYQHNRNQS